MHAPRLPHQILFNTSSSVAELDEWLAAHCRGETEVSFEGLSDDRRTKLLRIAFELPEDKEKLRAYIQSKRRGVNPHS